MNATKVKDLGVGDRVLEDGYRPYRIDRLRLNGSMLEADVSWLDVDGGSGRRSWPLARFEDEVKTR